MIGAFILRVQNVCEVTSGLIVSESPNGSGGHSLVPLVTSRDSY